MLFKKYTAPCRVNYVPSPYEPDEDGVMDVGYKIGVFSDGRPYRLECWRMDAILMLTVLFSNEGLTGYQRADMPLIVAPTCLCFWRAKKFCTLWALASRGCRLPRPPMMWAKRCGP